MSDPPEAPVTRARRRVKGGRTWRQRLANTTFWTLACTWAAEAIGTFPDIPFEGLWGFIMLASTPVAELMHVPAASLVHVRGRIRVIEPIATYLGQVDDAVYSRIELATSTCLRGVEARDFLLVDDTGATVEIRMDRAEVTLSKRMFRLRNRGVAMALLASGRLSGLRPAKLHEPTITEHWLAEGDELEVLGTVEQQVDPRREALWRELPTRLVLASAPGRPLTVQLVRPR